MINNKLLYTKNKEFGKFQSSVQREGGAVKSFIWEYKAPSGAKISIFYAGLGFTSYYEVSFSASGNFFSDDLLVKRFRGLHFNEDVLKFLKKFFGITDWTHKR